MAKLIGSEIITGNFGEDSLCKMLMDSFPDSYIIYRNRQVFGREFDMAIGEAVRISWCADSVVDFTPLANCIKNLQ